MSDTHTLHVDSDSPSVIYTVLALEMCGPKSPSMHVRLSGLGVCGAEAAMLKAEGCAYVEADIELTQPFDETREPWGAARKAALGAPVKRIRPPDATAGDGCDVCASFGPSTAMRLPHNWTDVRGAAEFDCVTLRDRTGALARLGSVSVDFRWLNAKRVVIEISPVAHVCLQATPLLTLPRHDTPIEIRVKGNDSAFTGSLASVLPPDAFLVTR